jgi:adenylate cyclase
MGLEVERKFLVIADKWRLLTKPLGEEYRQGYLVSTPEKTIRVRITPMTAFLTIKGKSMGISRSEFEYEIPISEAIELLEQFSISELRKVRYKVKHDNHLWEVDEFEGKHKGLILAEIELKDEAESFSIPDWVGQEVSGDERYYNSYLAVG